MYISCSSAQLMFRKHAIIFQHSAQFHLGSYTATGSDEVNGEAGQVRFVLVLGVGGFVVGFEV